MKEDSRKLPAIQFYPGDWKKDLGVQALTYEERGIWLELLFLMHESEDYGRLVIGGKPVSHEHLARILHLDIQKITQVISTLISLNVCGYDNSTEVIFSRRMVRDAGKRKGCAENGKKGGNPAFQKGKSNPYYNQTDNPQDKPTDKPEDNQNISPSSSSSSSSSSSEYINTSATDVASVEEPSSQEKNQIAAQQREWFDKWWERFWTKRDKQPAWKMFQKHIRTPERFAAMLQAFERDLGMMLKREPDRRPYGSTWLNKEPWEDGNQLIEIPRQEPQKELSWIERKYQEAIAKEAAEKETRRVAN